MARGGKIGGRNTERSPLELYEQDEHFYFIAGYTEGGFPFGTTWEEFEEQKRNEFNSSKEAGKVMMREMKLTRQQYKEIVDTYGMYVEGLECFLNIETGEVVMLRTFDLDEEDEELGELIEEGYNEVYFRIPPKESNEGYADMIRFTETIEDKKLRSSLEDALSGSKKVFRRFKDALSDDGEQLERYYLWLEERDQVRIADWLESIEVKVTFIS